MFQFSKNAIVCLIMMLFAFNTFLSGQAERSSSKKDTRAQKRINLPSEGKVDLLFAGKLQITNARRSVEQPIRPITLSPANVVTVYTPKGDAIAQVNIFFRIKEGSGKAVGKFHTVIQVNGQLQKRLEIKQLKAGETKSIAEKIRFRIKDGKLQNFKIELNPDNLIIESNKKNNSKGAKISLSGF